MIDVGYVGAFLGGLFTLVSPCSALLLPAFFAYAADSRTALLRRTAVFYLGLVVVLVPLGMGSAQASRIVFGDSQVLGLVAGLVLIGLGLVQILGGGLTIAPLSRLRARLRGDSVPSLLVLGAVSGLTGFCTGPVLGAVLTVAAASGQPLRGAVLLAVYAAGMAGPLFVLAAAWDRFDLGRRTWLRGRGVRWGRLRLHTTTAVSGLLFIAIGAAFLYGGLALAGLPQPPQGWSDAATGFATSAQRHVSDLAVVAVLAVLLVAVALWRWRRLGRLGATPLDPAQSDQRLE